MTIYWVTEAIPLPITGMIPMVAFPCKISLTKSFGINYLNFLSDMHFSSDGYSRY